MNTIAAYYVLVANDLAHESRRPHYQVVAPRKSPTGRIAAALSIFRRPARAAASSSD